MIELVGARRTAGILSTLPLLVAAGVALVAAATQAELDTFTALVGGF